MKKMLFLTAVAAAWIACDRDDECRPTADDGQQITILAGIASACVALMVMALATRAWMVFAIMPVIALAGIGTPALQSLATRLVDESRQGQLQGGHGL